MKKKKVKVKNISICILLLAISVLSYIVIDKKIDSNLKISLNGDKEIFLNYGEEYEELGASAKYENKDISKNIKIDSNLDLNHTGKYTIKYSIAYKKKKKIVERIIEVVDKESPIIELDDDKKVIIIGSDYSDETVKATDNYDGDITDKIEIDTSKLDTNAVGEYTVYYKVKDSSGNEATTSREIIVTNSFAQEIPVLNYHFFYEDNTTENCREIICEKMDTFRSQLQY